MKRDYVQVEGIKVDDLLINILSIGAFATVFEEELDKAVHLPKDFGCKGVVGGNSSLVDDAMFPFDVLHKPSELDC